MGVNLPARLVIIKSTLCYRGAGVGYTEYSSLEVEQMMGRAGRPQFDTHGVVVIMTDKKTVDDYKEHTFKKNDLESHFNDQLAEHLNAEISLKSIKNLGMALDYMKSTFYYVRMQKNPGHYGIAQFDKPDDFLAQQVKQVVWDLHRYDMIAYENQQPHDPKCP